MKIIWNTLLILMISVITVNVNAQSYPSKQVRLVFAFPPGSSADIVGRVFAEKLSEYWGQTAVVDNRPGAGGTIAAGIVAKAPPDGYTLLVHSSGHVVNPSIYKTLPYDVTKSFVDIAPLAQQPNVLVVGPNSNYKTVGEFIAAAKAKPGTLTVASAGTGSGTHLNLEKFKYDAKIDVNHIPYKGSSEALTDIVGGRVDAYFAPISSVLELVKGGKVRAIAVSTSKRSSLLPNVPTIAESGLPGFEYSLWFGLWGPAGIPPAIVEKIANDVKRASVDARGKLQAIGNEPLEMTQLQFTAYVNNEIKNSAVLLKAAGIEPQ
jgi:tripartite-type tricarboxylate transporter receptor subunit TctC